MGKLVNYAVFRCGLVYMLDSDGRNAVQAAYICLVSANSLSQFEYIRMEEALELPAYALPCAVLISSQDIITEPMTFAETPDSPLRGGKRERAGELETPFKRRKQCILTPKGRDLVSTPCLSYSLPRRTLLSDSPFCPAFEVGDKENHMEVEY